jgi:hypothetical protein
MQSYWMIKKMVHTVTIVFKGLIRVVYNFLTVSEVSLHSVNTLNQVGFIFQNFASGTFNFLVLLMSSFHLCSI